MIGRTDIYFPIFEAYLEAEELPEDLKYLPIVEAGKNHEVKDQIIFLNIQFSSLYLKFQHNKSIVQVKF